MEDFRSCMAYEEDDWTIDEVFTMTAKEWIGIDTDCWWVYNPYIERTE